MRPKAKSLPRSATSSRLNACHFRIVRSFCQATALAGLLATSSLQAGVQTGTVNYTFKTDIQQIQTGNIDGENFLTIQIPGEVGPMSCRSNILKVEMNNYRGNQQIETIAFSAMLRDDQVMITVPLSARDCVDGKPTVLDMYVIHNS